mgnify:CR=1 FL=1
MFWSFVKFCVGTIVQAVVTSALTIAGMLVVAQQLTQYYKDGYYTDFQEV